MPRFSSRFSVLAGLIVCLACQPSEPPRPRLVILYATCSLNRDFLSPYDASVTYTPALDAFKKRALVFQRHHTEAGRSGTDFATLFSGTQADRHGVYAHPKRLPDSLTLITEAFEAGGYKSYSWANHPMASDTLNYTQGVPKRRRSSKRLRWKDKRFEEILLRLDRDPEFKAFIVTNFTVTHNLYGRSLSWITSDQRIDAFCGRYPGECTLWTDREELHHYRRIYYNYRRGLSYDFDATIEALALDDAQVAQLIEAIRLLYKVGVERLDLLFGGVVAAVERAGLTDQTLFAFTSDHGEMLHRENAFFFWSHGYQQAPDVLRVALMLGGPGLVPGSYQAVTRSIDVFPTLAGFAGVPIPNGQLQGEDLSVAIHAGRERPDLLAFSHSTVLPYMVESGKLPATRNFGSFYPRRDPELMWVSVRDHDLFYKLRRQPKGGFRSFVFDLAVDPSESKNLFDPRDVEQREMFVRLQGYRERLIAGYWASEGGPNPSEEEQLELLRSLGYVE